MNQWVGSGAAGTYGDDTRQIPAETGGASGYISGRFAIGSSDLFSFSDDDFVYTDPEAYSPLRLSHAIIKRGYSLQFARRPPRFSGVVSTSVQGENARVLRSEVMTLLEKGAIEMVSPALSESGFYNRYFLVPKKDGGLRPILDLRRLNHAFMRRLFRIITLKQILSQIRTEDWFCSLDLKDAYFHIQLAPHHRRFLRFAFEGVAYQYTVLPFGLSLAPHTFTKCMDAALSPLRQMGIRILNYLDDWLILAQSEVELLSHRTLILSHLERLGLRVNFAKKCTVSQPTNIVPGYSSGLSSHESGDSARTRSGHSETRHNLAAIRTSIL